MRTSPTSRLRRAAVAAIALAAAQCGGGVQDGGTLSGFDARSGTGVGLDDAAEPRPGPGERNGVQLRFDRAEGHDERPCAGTARCRVAVGYDAPDELGVRYTEDGEPVAQRVVEFAVVEDPKGLAHLSALSALTGAEGRASVQVGAAEPKSGHFTVRARPADGRAPARFFDVTVTPNGIVPLTVAMSYEGARAPERYRVHVVRDEDADAAGCANPGALRARRPAGAEPRSIEPGRAVTVPRPPGLEADEVGHYTVLILARNADDVVVARGCEEGVPVRLDEGRTVTVSVADRPPEYAGTYRMRTMADVPGDLPPPYRSPFQRTLELLRRPSREVLELACRLDEHDAALTQLCQTVFVDPDDPGSSALTAVGAAAGDAIEASLEDWTPGTPWGEVIDGARNLAGTLSALELRGSLELHQEPGAPRSWSPGETGHTWTEGRLHWSVEAAGRCDPASGSDCGTFAVPLGEIQTALPHGAFGAEASGFWQLSIEPHPMPLELGALLDQLTQRAILPRLAGGEPGGDGESGAPAIDSWGRMIRAFLGGRQCLAPDGPDCCQRFMDGMLARASAELTPSAPVMANACDSLVEAGRTHLSRSLRSPDETAGPGVRLETAEACALRDPDGDLVVDGLGAASAPCRWRLSSDGGDDATEVPFWGGRPETR